MIATRAMPVAHMLVALGAANAGGAGVVLVEPAIRERPPAHETRVDLPAPLVVPPRSELPTGTVPRPPPPPPPPPVRADPAAKARRKAARKARKKNRR